MIRLSPNNPIFKGKGPSEIFYWQAYFTLISICLSVFSTLPTLVISAGSQNQVCNAPTGTQTTAQAQANYKTNWVGPFDCVFNKFDASLGSLKSVAVSLDGSVVANIKVERQDSSSDNNSIANVKSLARADLILGNSFTNSTLLTVTPEASLTDKLNNYDGKLDYAGPSGRSNLNLRAEASNSTSISDPALLSSFIGNPNSTYKFPVSTVGRSSCEGSGNIVCQNETFSAATVKLVYNYSSKIVSNDVSRANQTAGQNIALDTALSAKTPDTKVAFFTIKSLPEKYLCQLYQKTLSGDIPVVAGQVVDLSQLPNLFCKPADGSEGKQASFKYTTTDASNTESEAATVTLNFLKQGQSAQVLDLKTNTSSKPEIEAATNDSGLKAENCTIKAKMGQNLALENCFKLSEGQAASFKVSNIRVGLQKNGEKCGDFYLQDSKLANGQVISAADKENIEFLINSLECEKCDIGFDYVGIAEDKSESNLAKVRISIDGCAPAVEATAADSDAKRVEIESSADDSGVLARTGGLLKNTQEVFVLVGVLIAAIIFFFSTLSTENIKKIFSRK
jgi:hypothetical protein